MSLGEAVGCALAEESVSVAATGPAEAQPAVLSRREREVAALIGRGFTNRRIATELAITERTVENHVSRILHKLGLRSRTQIATWMIQQGQPAGHSS